MHGSGFSSPRSSHADRRRRLLSEDGRNSVTTDDLPTGPAQPAQRYTESANPEHQARVTDFLPTRKLTLAGLFCIGLLLIGGLGAGYCYLPRASDVAQQHLTVLDLNSPNCLAVWVASLMMSVAGMGAFLIYTLRRHRLDDYRGRYRLWLWVGLAWWLMSVAEVTGFNRDLQWLGTNWTGRAAVGGLPWWLWGWGLTVGVLTLRLGLEIRASRTALTAWFAMLGCWGVTVAMQLGWSPETGLPPILLTVGTKLLGHLCLLLMTGVYARHVLLDIQGLVPVRERKPRVKRVKRTEARTEVGSDEIGESAPKKRIVIDPPHTSANTTPGNNRRSDVEATVPSASIPNRPPPTLPPAPSLLPAAAKANVSRDSEEDDDTSSGRKLSRAERKRLRRQRDDDR